jgi:hypothetical protein
MKEDNKYSTKGAGMKRIFEDLLFQILIEQVMTRTHQMLDWLNTMPWQVWLA